MDTELDADIESLKSLISDEINNSNNDDCSQNSFDAELNLLATTLKENDVKNEPSNEIEGKCIVQNNISSEIEPNNHIIDNNLKESIKQSPLQESHKMNDVSVSNSEVVECDEEFHNCDFNEENSGLQSSTIERSTDCTVIENKDMTEKNTASTAIYRSQCSISLNSESDECCETGVNSGNMQEDCEKCINKVGEEIVEENCTDTNMTDISNISSVDENETRCEIHCSTPLIKELTMKKVTADVNSIALFGSLSPLTANRSAVDGLSCMKRKLCSETLPSIKEEDEEELIVPVKKPKCDTEDSCATKNLKAHMKTIEPPAMAILKKWRPKFLSASSSSTFYIIDECDDPQSSQSEKEDDDFEIAMKSLSEELIRQSDADDLKTLDLYHNHVLAENEEDGLKFEEILQQMTIELEGMSEYICLGKTDGSIPSTDDVGKNEITVIEIDCEENLSSTLTNDSQKNHDSTLVEKQSVESSAKSEDKLTPADTKLTIGDDGSDDDIIIIKENVKPVENHSEELSSNNNNITEYINLTADEEDVLLEDEPEETDASQKKKPREMVEFISTDPKENEDNFNPEWELLRKLNTDEERYKAVRQRWRSLVIPDPKRDLTFRQWRRRNNLPPSKHLQGNIRATKQQIRKFVGNQLCTALFDQNIEDILRKKEEKRLSLYKELQMDLRRLGRLQAQEQQKFLSLGGSHQEYSLMFLHHMEEVRRLQSKHQKRVENEERASFEKIDALKNASAEVLAFERFYQGLDNDKKDNAAFLSDVEIQELMETELMLEQYDRYYV